MKIILNEVIVSKGMKGIKYNNLYSKIIDLLKERGSLTFPEIANELNLENGDREVLISILRKLEAEGKIKSSKTHINIKNGISLTNRFFL